MNSNPAPNPEETIFACALDLPAAERDAYLEQACGANAALRRAVESLLRAHEGDTGFMAAPGGRDAVELVTLLRANRPVLEAVGDRLGRYKLLQKIGEGGCGTVYMAEQQEPVRRRVALKVIKLGMDTKEVIARFEAERQALAMMDHPNIARVLDAGETETGRPFFVMELVRGIKITDYCDQHSLPTAERLRLFTQVCHAVQHAHQKGVIHRDLKPSNILVTLHDGTPLPKVIDFGIAKATQGRLTDSTLFTAFEQFIGTPAYMSPEQAQLSSMDVDTRSDIYSLGVLLYELLTGRTPFESKELLKVGLDEMRRQIREVEPPRPSTRLRTLDQVTLTATAQQRHIDAPKLINLINGDLDWIVMRCLEKDRARRYETATSLAQDLQRHLDHEPVVARPAGGFYRFRKLVRRNRLAFGASAAVLLTLVVGILGTTVGLIRAEKSRRSAEISRQAEAEQRKLAEAAEATAQAKERQAASERDRAEQEKRVAVAVKDFLQNRLLSQANPFSQADALLKAGDTSSELKPDPTIRELLDRAAAELTPEKIESQFPNLPLVQAEILRTIGETYMKLSQGAWESGIAHLERARDLYLRQLGADHEETFATLNALGVAYMRGLKLREAAQTLEQVRDKQMTMLGADNPITLETLHNLAWSYRDSGRLADALQLIEQVYAKRSAILGAEHRDTIRTLNEVAEANSQNGDPKKSIPLFERVRDWRSAKLGPEHPDTLWTLWSMAKAYRNGGKPAEGIALFEEVRARAMARLGPDYLLSQYVTNSLANAYMAEGRVPEAVSMFEEELKRRKVTSGSEHHATAKAMHYLAHAYARTPGRKSEELALFETALKITRTQLGVDHAQTLEGLQCLAVAYRNANRPADALPLFKELVERNKETLSEDHPRTLTSINNLAATQASLGLNLIAQKKFTEAEAVLRAAVKVREKMQDDWRYFNTQSALGAALLGQMKFAEAESLLLSGYAGMKAREQSIPANSKTSLRRGLERLIQLYTAKTEPTNAAEWQAKLDELPSTPQAIAVPVP